MSVVKLPELGVNPGRIRFREVNHDSLKDNPQTLVPGQPLVVHNIPHPTTSSDSVADTSDIAYLRVGGVSGGTTGTLSGNSTNKILKLVPEPHTVTRNMLTQTPAYTVLGNNTGDSADLFSLTGSQLTNMISRFGPETGGTSSGFTGASGDTYNQTVGLVNINSGTDNTWLGDSEDDYDTVLRRDGKWAKQLRVGDDGKNAWTEITYQIISNNKNTGTNDKIRLSIDNQGNYFTLSSTSDFYISADRIRPAVGSQTYTFPETLKITDQNTTTNLTILGAINKQSIIGTGDSNYKILCYGTAITTSNHTGANINSLFYYSTTEHTLWVNTGYGGSSPSWNRVAGTWN